MLLMQGFQRHRKSAVQADPSPGSGLQGSPQPSATLMEPLHQDSQKHIGTQSTWVIWTSDPDSPRRWLIAFPRKTSLEASLVPSCPQPPGVLFSLPVYLFLSLQVSVFGNPFLSTSHGSLYLLQSPVTLLFLRRAI